MNCFENDCKSVAFLKDQGNLDIKKLEVLEEKPEGSGCGQLEIVTCTNELKSEIHKSDKGSK